MLVFITSFVLNPNHLAIFHADLLMYSAIPPRLVTDLKVPSTYATLSYCWGGDQTMKLRTALLSSYSQFLPVNDLPRTLRDAIKIERELDIRYLWIDSLCINQDATIEKAQDLAWMGDIYRNSVLTLMAAKGSSADAGMLQHAVPHDMTQCLPWLLDQGPATEEEDHLVHHPPFAQFIDAQGLRSTPVSLTPVPTITDAYLKMHKIESRGWTLQERVLSHRLLIYSETNIRWLCNTTEDCDGGSCELLGRHPLPGALRHLDWRANPMKTWHAMVGEYSRRQISLPSDKLPAIAALAQNCAQETSFSYASGLWMQNLASDLIWFRQTNSRYSAQSVPYVAPTWSWASISDPVGWLPEKQLDGFEKDLSFTALEYLRTLLYDEVPFGAVTSASLRISGRLLRLGKRSQVRTRREGGTKMMASRLFLDDERPTAGDAILYALLLGSVASVATPRSGLVGLILCSENEDDAEGSTGTFTRAGVFFGGYLSKDEFSSASVQEITLL